MRGTFRLGVVLRLRELAEDAARARLAMALTCQREASYRLVALVERERDAQRRLADIGIEGGRAGDLVAVQRALEVAEQATLEGQQALADATGALIGARTELADASRRRDVVERLRDRIRAAEALEAQRREDAVLSELAGVRHARSMVAEVEW
jgi:flagellar export protein FliJ